MLFSIDYLITDVVIFYDVLETSVVSEQSKLDYVITKLFPLHGLVAIDIYFFEEIDEGECEHEFELLVRFIVI